MSNVVDERCGESTFCPVGAELVLAKQALNPIHQNPGSMENTNAVREPRVRRAWVNEFAEAKLLYSPEPLEGARLDNFPHRILKLARTELDQIM